MAEFNGLTARFEEKSAGCVLFQMLSLTTLMPI